MVIMVDFNNPEMLSSNTEYLIQLLVLESYYNVMTSIEDYYSKLIRGGNPPINNIKSISNSW